MNVLHPAIKLPAALLFSLLAIGASANPTQWVLVSPSAPTTIGDTSCVEFVVEARNASNVPTPFSFTVQASVDTSGGWPAGDSSCGYLNPTDLIPLENGRRFSFWGRANGGANGAFSVAAVVHQGSTIVPQLLIPYSFGVPNNNASNNPPPSDTTSSTSSSTLGYIDDRVVSDLFGSNSINFGVNNAPTDTTCSYFGRQFIFDATTDEGRNMLSILLAAKLSGTKVHVWYHVSTLPGTTNSNGCHPSNMANAYAIGLAD